VNIASTVIFRYVFITSGSPYCSRYFSAARVRSGSLILTSKRVLQHPRNRGRHQSAQAGAMAADVAGEKTRSHRRDLEKNKPSDETEHKKTWHDDNQPLGRVNVHCSAGQIVDEEMTHHAHSRCGDDLIE